MPLLSAQAVLKAEAALIGGKPQLTKRYHTAPLKIAKAFGLNDASGPQLAVVQMDASPGMLNGDRYGFDWSIGEKTRLYVTNQAYTRVHPCPRSDARAEMRFRLARDAVLEWMPEPVMLFREARYASSTEIELEPGAVCIAADLICPGRAARGEAFDFASCAGIRPSCFSGRPDASEASRIWRLCPSSPTGRTGRSPTGLRTGWRRARERGSCSARY
ncbi:urease accessory protein UreD [Cohnella thermotolerans]|uniref:urease accessory protein UreD n=1 Tax=Cohnella thermotolerans TaxID=329858 RepID=UPI00040FBC8E|nr:urease accessory protein UreD [Cohnella thermotolerans]